MIAGSWADICLLPFRGSGNLGEEDQSIIVASNSERQYLTEQRHKCDRTFARFIAKISLLAPTTLAEVEERR
jgi:hypothetical protein